MRRDRIAALRLSERLGMTADEMLSRMSIIEFQQRCLLSAGDAEVRDMANRKDLPIPYDAAFQRVFFPEIKLAPITRNRR